MMSTQITKTLQSECMARKRPSDDYELEQEETDASPSQQRQQSARRTTLCVGDNRHLDQCDKRGLHELHGDVRHA